MERCSELVLANRVAALAWLAGAAKVSALLRLPNQRRWATLVAFVYCLEATAQADSQEVVGALLRELFGDAIKAEKKARVRPRKDLDQAAATLACACRMMLHPELPDAKVRARLFEKIPRDVLTLPLHRVNTLIRPSDDVYFRELGGKRGTVRRYLPTLLEDIRLDNTSNPTYLEFLAENNSV